MSNQCSNDIPSDSRPYFQSIIIRSTNDSISIKLQASNDMIIVAFQMLRSSYWPVSPIHLNFELFQKDLLVWDITSWLVNLTLAFFIWSLPCLNLIWYVISISYYTVFFTFLSPQPKDEYKNQSVNWKTRANASLDWNIQIWTGSLNRQSSSHSQS